MFRWCRGFSENRPLTGELGEAERCMCHSAVIKMASISCVGPKALGGATMAPRSGRDGVQDGAMWGGCRTLHEAIAAGHVILE
jgi:hypothetical protein